MPISLREMRVVLQKSGNRCAFPGCRRLLTADGTPPDREVVLGEIAHIVAQSPDGPRGESHLSPTERNTYRNLVLLCNIHHQLVDDQPQTYTVDRLLAIKEDHERWIEKTLGKNGDHNPSIVPNRVKETIYSTLLPVERMPEYVYGVPCAYADEHEVAPKMKATRGDEMAPFILRAGMLFSFQNLNYRGGPFADLVPGESAERYSCREWWEDQDRLKWFVDLTNRALNKLTGRRGLWLDRAHHRYYFQPESAGRELKIAYRPLNQKVATRSVVWQPVNKRTGEARNFWYHRAVSLRFLRTDESSWCLSIRPELKVTVDGVKELRSDYVGSKVTKKKSRMFNYGLLAEVNFWRDFLSDSKPRIIMPFGPQQNIVISTNLLEGEVHWPGIPEEHTKPFKNVNYVDDLFSWAELAYLDDESEDDKDEDAWEDNEDEDEY